MDFIKGQLNVSADLVEDNQIDIILFLMGVTNYMNESFVVEWRRYTSLGCPYEDHGMKKFRGNTYSIQDLQEDSTYNITVTELSRENCGTVSITVSTMATGEICSHECGYTQLPYM